MRPPPNAHALTEDCAWYNLRVTTAGQSITTPAVVWLYAYIAYQPDGCKIEYNISTAALLLRQWNGLHEAFSLEVVIER